MTDKEILVQLALGTFDLSLLLRTVQDTKDPKIIVATAHLFVKLDINKYSITDGITADVITNAFIDNEFTPQLVKDYIMAARQIKHLEHKQCYSSTDAKCLKYEIKSRKANLKILYNRIFKD